MAPKWPSCLLFLPFPVLTWFWFRNYLSVSPIWSCELPGLNLRGLPIACVVESKFIISWTSLSSNPGSPPECWYSFWVVIFLSYISFSLKWAQHFPWRLLGKENTTLVEVTVHVKIVQHSMKNPGVGSGQAWQQILSLHIYLCDLEQGTFNLFCKIKLIPYVTIKDRNNSRDRIWMTLWHIYNNIKHRHSINRSRCYLIDNMLTIHLSFLYYLSTF